MNRTNAKALEGRIDQNTTIYYQNGKPYTGLVYEELQGRIDLEYEVVNGVKQGVEIEYYPNGRVQSISHYVNNVLNGLLVNYYESGIIEEKAMFEKGVCIHSTAYDEAGQITEENTISEESPEYSWLTYLRQKSGV
jgi:antitoxin component YwqK of YwqJK toxin-antitoxin module